MDFKNFITSLTCTVDEFFTWYAGENWYNSENQTLVCCKIDGELLDIDEDNQIIDKWLKFLHQNKNDLINIEVYKEFPNAFQCHFIFDQYDLVIDSGNVPFNTFDPCLPIISVNRSADDFYDYGEYCFMDGCSKTIEKLQDPDLRCEFFELLEEIRVDLKIRDLDKSLDWLDLNTLNYLNSEYTNPFMQFVLDNSLNMENMRIYFGTENTIESRIF